MDRADDDEARRRQLAGTLVISVAIRRDGSVERAEVIQSSGSRLLDDAALREKMRGVLAVNMGALALSMIGLMAVIAGIMLG